MEVRFETDTSRLTARLDTILPSVKEALETALGRVAQEVASDARTIAAAHIRYLGKKPGQYLASIYGGVNVKGASVIGYVRSGDPLAHLLERGTVERFKASTGASTGAISPPYPALGPAFANASAEIRDAIEAAVQRAVR